MPSLFVETVEEDMDDLIQKDVETDNDFLKAAYAKLKKDHAAFLSEMQIGISLRSMNSWMAPLGNWSPVMSCQW